MRCICRWLSQRPPGAGASCRCCFHPRCPPHSDSGSRSGSGRNTQSWGSILLPAVLSASSLRSQQRCSLGLSVPQGGTSTSTSTSTSMSASPSESVATVATIIVPLT